MINRKKPTAWIHLLKDPEELFSSKDIDIAVITTPNTTHYDLANRALKSGFNVIVEKPFTVTSIEALKLIETSKITKKLLTVHHNRRWDSDFLTVEKIINRKLLGKLLEIDIRFDRYRKDINQSAWKSKDLPGSGMLYDLGSHLIFQALKLFGDLGHDHCICKKRKGKRCFRR